VHDDRSVCSNPKNKGCDYSFALASIIIPLIIVTYLAGVVPIAR
jgi:hypothetical protein